MYDDDDDDDDGGDDDGFNDLMFWWTQSFTHFFSVVYHCNIITVHNSVTTHTTYHIPLFIFIFIFIFYFFAFLSSFLQVRISKDKSRVCIPSLYLHPLQRLVLGPRLLLLLLHLHHPLLGFMIIHGKLFSARISPSRSYVMSHSITDQSV